MLLVGRYINLLLCTRREFCVHVETHTSLFHPDHQLTVVEGGRKQVKTVDTRHFVVGQLEGIYTYCSHVVAEFNNKV